MRLLYQLKLKIIQEICICDLNSANIKEEKEQKSQDATLYLSTVSLFALIKIHVFLLQITLFCSILLFLHLKSTCLEYQVMPFHIKGMVT